MTTATPERTTLAREMMADPSLTPHERAWWEAVVEMGKARRRGASEAELERLELECHRLAEGCA